MASRICAGQHFRIDRIAGKTVGKKQQNPLIAAFCAEGNRNSRKPVISSENVFAGGE
jgi:hypothetical protein